MQIMMLLKASAKTFFKKVCSMIMASKSFLVTTDDLSYAGAVIYANDCLQANCKTVKKKQWRLQNVCESGSRTTRQRSTTQQASALTLTHTDGASSRHLIPCGTPALVVTVIVGAATSRAQAIYFYALIDVSAVASIFWEPVAALTLTCEATCIERWKISFLKHVHVRCAVSVMTGLKS